MRVSPFRKSDAGEGIRSSVHENAPAFGYSIMITSSYGVTSLLAGRPAAWMIFLFAFGAVAGFVLVQLVATHGLRVTSTEAERDSVHLLVAALGLGSVLCGAGAAALLAWPLQGWVAWLVAPAGASASFVFVNGLEYAVANEEEERR